jgi:hypothetical protein
VIRFDFAPIPRDAFVALRSGELAVSEWRVLAALYDRANVRSWTVSIRDLDTLARYCAWDLELDTLSKVLRSLREKGWIDYVSKPGATRHPYVIRLLHGPLGRSEHDPSRNGRSEAVSEAEAAATNPSSAATDPSNPDSANGATMPDDAASEPPSIRAPSDVSEKTSLGKEDVGTRASRETLCAQESEVTSEKGPLTDPVKARTAQQQEDLVASTDRLLDLIRERRNQTQLFEQARFGAYREDA